MRVAFKYNGSVYVEEFDKLIPTKTVPVPNIFDTNDTHEACVEAAFVGKSGKIYIPFELYNQYDRQLEAFYIKYGALWGYVLHNGYFDFTKETFEFDGFKYAINSEVRYELNFD